jgi:molybdate transport system permease protein
MPFVVQPLQNAFEAVGEPLLEAAASLARRGVGHVPVRGVPLSRSGFVTAAILGFTHTVGNSAWC